MSSFGRTEKIILILAMVSLMVFSYFLYDDSLLFSNSNNTQLELIGDVTISQNDVRRKNVDNFSWLPALTKDKVFQNDSIFTGDGSEATILLHDGTQIKIQPNSLITLNLKNGQMNLDLRYGNLVSELAQESSLVIKSGTEEIKLENTKGSPEKPKIQFKKSHSGPVDLKLISGGAKYSTKTQQVKQELPKKAEVSVVNNGQIKEVEKPTIILKTADNIQWLREKPNDPISFDWEVKGKASKFKLEISTADTFDSITLSKLSTAKTTNLTDSLQSGTYFWRLKALDQYGDVSATSIIQKFNLTEIQKPEITNPKQAEQINLELKVKPKEVPVTTTEIQWTAQPIIKTFIWQLAQDEQFKNIITENKTTGLAAVTPRLQSGTYWVRVQGQTESHKTSSWSQPVSFSLNLVAQKEQPPKRPILITKLVNFAVPTKNQNETQAPKLAWQPVLETKEYRLEISPDNSFKTSEKLTFPQTQVLWKQYRPGKYFFRVYAVGINELPSEYSDIGNINVKVGEIALSPIKPIVILDEKALPQETKINWNEIAFAKKYIVQMDQTKDFFKPVQLEYTANSGTLSLPAPGNYNVRVQALDENNKPLTPFSKIEKAQYILNTPLTSPVLSEPFDKASIFLQTQMEPFIWLEWSKVPRAVYKIEVSNKKDFSTVLISTSTKENRYLIKEKMPLGKLYWRVQAYTTETAEQSLWTPAREFTLHHQKNETLIK